MSVYQLTLKTLSPLHIGDGSELRQGFDFAVHAGQTYRLNEDAVLTAHADRLQAGPSGHYPLPGQLLEQDDFQNTALFRYVLRGYPRSKKADARLRACIKDVYDRPYIPGSSLKGAIRTALAWTGWPEVKPRLEAAAIGRSRSWAGRNLEHSLFGPDPNHDLLRAVQVSDLYGPQQAGQGVILVNAQVLTRRSAGSPVELEAIAGDVSFSGSLTIDEALFSPLAEKTLGFSNRRHWLDEIAARLQAHSRERIQRLAEWFEHTENAHALAVFYRRLASAGLGPNQALVQIGWGSGWDGKTFWTRLLADPQLFARLVQQFRMQKTGPRSPRYRPGDPFPSSRRVAMLVKDGVARPAAPFGWALLEMEAIR
jgi:CRISPR-associated protein Csm5